MSSLVLAIKITPETIEIGNGLQATFTGNEELLTAEATYINKTSSEICIDHKDKSKYSDLISLNRHNLNEIPLNITNNKDKVKIKDDKSKVDLSFKFLKLSSKDCFIVEYENISDVELKIGWNSIKIEDVASGTESLLYPTHNKMIITNNGSIVIGYEDGGDDITVAISYDNGTTFTSNEIKAGSFNDIIVSYDENIDSVYVCGLTTTYTHCMNSSDLTNWNEIGNIWALSNAITHDTVFCNDVVYFAKSIIDKIYITNNTNFQSETLIFQNLSLDNIYLSMECYNDNLFLGITESATDSFYLIDGSDNYNWYKIFDGVTSDNTAIPSFVITNNNNVYFSFEDSGDLYIYNSTLSNLNTWDLYYENISTLFYPILNKGWNDTIYFSYGTRSGPTEGLSKTLYGNFTDYINLTPITAIGPVSIAHTQFLREQNKLHYFWADSSNDLYYENMTINTDPIIDTCTCAGIDTNWEIDETDNCNIVDDCDLGNGNITFINTGSFTCNAQISFYDRTSGNITMESGCYLKKNG